ncbi:MAG: hypothetical protein ABR954_06370 [Dehalococcoidales bacterium]
MTSNLQSKKSRLELEYNKLFPNPAIFPTMTENSLEQPSPLKIVPSVATSGAYEEPIQFDRMIIPDA